MGKKAGPKGSINVAVRKSSPLPNTKNTKNTKSEDIEPRDESESDLDGDNEIDQDDSSDASGDDDSESEATGSEVDLESAEELDSDSVPKKKKRKTDDGSQQFANAFNAILGSKLKAHKRNDPIMARSKNVQKQLDSAKLEAKAKRQLLAEKKTLQDRHRVKNLLPSASEPERVRSMIEEEKKLKKVAQKGVVRLFNAVLLTQVKTSQEISGEKVGAVRKEELINEVSKEQFLDLVQAAGNT